LVKPSQGVELDRGEREATEGLLYIYESLGEEGSADAKAGNRQATCARRAYEKIRGFDTEKRLWNCTYKIPGVVLKQTDTAAGHKHLTLFRWFWE
jgi:hypothetical protein